MARKRYTADRSSARGGRRRWRWRRGNRFRRWRGASAWPSRADYRWRREYGGLRVDQAKRLQELERENSRRKRLVAEQALDNAMLRDVAAGNV